MRSRFTQQRLILLINIIVSVGLGALLLNRVDWRLLTTALSQLQGGFVALALISFASIALLEVARLRMVLAPFAPDWGVLIRVHVIGAFFGNFLPGQLGADLYKIVVLRPLDESAARPLTLILLLRLLGLVVLLAAVVMSLLLHGQRLRPGSVSVRWTLGLDLPLLTVLSIAVLVVMGLLISARLRSPLFDRIRVFRQHAKEALMAITGPQIVELFGLSLLVLAVRVLVLSFLVAAVGSSLGVIDTLFVVSLATLITLLPLSFAGWGLRESTVTVLLVHLSVPYEQAVLVALFGRAFILLLSGAGGAWLLSEIILTKTGSRG